MPITCLPPGRAAISKLKIYSGYFHLLYIVAIFSDIYDQRVKVGSDHPRDRGYFLPVQNFTRIRFNPPDVWMSLCVIRLLIPANEPLMRLPSERQLTAHGSRLVWFGYGTNRWLNHFLLARQTVSMPATTVDFNICQDSYFNLPGIGSQDYCILTAEAPVRERNVLGLYDAGGPLVSTETNTIWGVGVTLFPYFKDRFPQHTKHQLFAAVAPYRDEIVEAMQAMDAAAK